MRIKSEIWVRAYLRVCQSSGIPAYIARRGDEHAGAIYICLNRLDGTVELFGPAPVGLETSNSERRWVACFKAPITEDEVLRYLARQIGFDPDIWVVEIEDKQGRHFLGDGALQD